MRDFSRQCVRSDARLFTGRLRLIVRDDLAPVDPVVTVTDPRSTDGEQGLLGVAVDPGWPARPYLHVAFDWSGGPTNHIRRYTLAGDLEFHAGGALTADPAPAYEVLDDIPDCNGPHNASTLRFGPDGMLYASTGDDLFHCDAQDPGQFFGKILRLDVSQLPDGPGGPPPYTAIAPHGNPFAPCVGVPPGTGADAHAAALTH